MRKYRNQIIIGFAIALIVYVIVAVILDVNTEVLKRLTYFPMWVIGPVILFQISTNFFRFLEWHYYLGVVDARDKIGLKDSVLIFIAGFAMAATPGKVGEFVKSIMLKIKADVPLGRSAPIVIAERVVDSVAVTLTLLAALLLAGEGLQLGSYYEFSVVIVVISALSLCVGMMAVQSVTLANIILYVAARLPLVNRLTDTLEDYFVSCREVFRLRHVVLTTIMGLGVYLSSNISFMLILWGFGITPTPLLFIQGAFILGMSSAIGALSFVPNGAGVTEVSTVAMLLAIVTPNHPEMTPILATAITLMQGFFYRWLRVLFGIGVAVAYRERLFTPEFDAEFDALQAQKHSEKADTETENQSRWMMLLRRWTADDSG